MEPALNSVRHHQIYADFNGSAPLTNSVREYLTKRLQDGPYANPNSIHIMGQRVLLGLEKTRRICADKLGALPNQLLFNSGATEGINHVFYSLTERAKKTGKKLIFISGIEHSAIYNCYQYYLSKGFEGKIIPTTPEGLVRFDILKDWLKEFVDDVAFVSVMAANNENGTIQPFNEIGIECNLYGIPYFCDTTQFIGKRPFSFQDSCLDYAVMSGHKVGAMTGTGLILAKKKKTLLPHIIGGGQENGLRGGTQNYLGLETLGVALESLPSHEGPYQELEKKRIDFEKKIKEAFPTVFIVGEDAPRLPNTTYISYPGIHGQAVQIELESQNIFVSTSSACSDNNPKTSRVLAEMNIDDSIGRGVVRISTSLCSPPDVYERIFSGLKTAYEKLSKIHFR